MKTFHVPTNNIHYLSYGYLNPNTNKWSLIPHLKTDTTYNFTVYSITYKILLSMLPIINISYK